MYTIGIIGNADRYEAMEILSNLYSAKGLSVYGESIAGNVVRTKDDLGFKLPDVAVFTMYPWQLRDFVKGGIKMDTLILLEAIDEKTINSDLLKTLSPQSNVIVNSDEEKVHYASYPKNIKIISCGWDARSNVTISSVSPEYEENTIQYCIKKTLSNIYGKKIEPQEFTLKLKEIKNVTGVLAAVTAAITHDTEISELISPLK